MKTINLSVMLLLVIATSAGAHGIEYFVDHQDTLCIQFLYTGGEPVSYAEVTISGPNSEKLEFQNGRTDKHGRFAFVPDKSGTWSVKISDGLGHAIGAELTFNSSKKAFSISQVHKEEGVPAEKVIMGLAIILFLFGAFFWWKGISTFKKAKITINNKSHSGP